MTTKHKLLPTPCQRIRTSWRNFCLALVLGFLAGTATLGRAQYRASIQGVVTDQQGAVVPGAQVTLQDLATNLTLTTSTSGEGVYNFYALPPSHFKLTVSMAGFASRVIDNVTLIPEQVNAINVALQIGATAESVTVNSVEVPALNTATASINGTITSNQLQHMPAFGRDVTQLAQLAPGVFGDGGLGAGGGTRNLPGTNQGGGGSTDGIFKTENGPQVVANGAQTNANSVMIDGISVSSVTWGGTTAVTPNADSVESVKVTANDYDAEVGRFSGAQIQITSKSGSNDYHGSFFFKAERPGLNAYQRWNGANKVQRDTSRFNDFGGSVSGPAWKNRIFPFFAYETLRNNSQSYGSGWYETADYLKSAPTGSNAAKYLGYAGEGVSYQSLTGGTCALLGLQEGPYCRTISGKGVDLGSPLTTPLGTHDPSWKNSAQPGYGGSPASPTGVADLALYNTVSPNERTASQYYGRLDAQITQNDRASFMMYWVPLDSLAYNGPIRAANLWHHSQTNDAFTGLWNHTFSPTLVNEARVNAGGWRWNEITSNPQEAFGLAQANFGVAGDAFPNLNLNFFGAPSPSVFNQWTYGYEDVLTKSLGRHSIKMGGEVTRLYYLNEQAWNGRPSFLFTNLWDFLNDAPYSESGTFNPSSGFPTTGRQDNRETLWAIFAQDDWRVTPTLTLNLGLRYSYFTPYYDKGNNLRKVSLGNGSSMVTGLTVQKADQLWKAQKGNFGPQLGFAWNPDQFNRKLVVRGGFGINYNQNEMAITGQSSNNPGNTVGASFCCSQSGSTGTNNIQYVLPSDLTNFYGFPSNSAAVTGFGSNGLPSNTATTVNVWGFDPEVKTIMTYHYSLGTEYSIGSDWVASLGYQGSTAHHLYLQQDMNVLAVANNYALNPQLTRVYYYGNKGNANYNALLSSIRHNFSRSFQAEAQYTWSKSMDNGSQPYYMDMYPYELRYSWGPSDYNVQNAFKLFGMYQPNFFHGALLHGLADGWTLSGIWNLHSGFPWTPSYGGVGNIYYYNSGQSTLRPAAYLGGSRNDLSNQAFQAKPGTGNSNFPNGGTSYFVKPAYTPVTSGTTTTVGPLPQAPGMGRNSFMGPRFNNVDLSLAKGFHFPNSKVLGEGAMVEFRVDTFNLFNKINLNSPTTEITSPTFGQSQNAMGGRVIDMQARFSF